MKKLTILKNSFWKNTLFYGVGFILLRSISFLLLPFYTTALTPHVAGEVFIFFAFLAFMNSFFSFGMDSALLKFHSKNHQIFSTSILSVFIFALPLCALLFFSNDIIAFSLFTKTAWTIYGYNWSFFIISILLFDALSSRAMTLIRKIELPIYYLAISFINVVTSLFLTWYFVTNIQVQSLRLNGVILAMLCVSIIQFICLLPIIILNLKKPLFDKKIFKKMFLFAWPFFPATIFFIIIELSDRIILEHLCGLNQVGLYGAGYKIAALILMIVRAFNLNWQPYYIKQGQIHEYNQAHIKNNFSQIGSMFLIFLITIIALLSSLWPQFIPFIVGPKFIEGGQIIPIIALAYGFYGLFIIQMPSLYIKNKQKWSPLIWGSGAIINIVGNIILIKWFELGFIGAAFATLAAYFTMALVLIILNQKWLKITYNNFLLGISVVISLLLFLANYCLSIGYQYNIMLCCLYSCIMLNLFYKAKNI